MTIKKPDKWMYAATVKKGGRFHKTKAPHLQFFSPSNIND